MSNIAIVGSRTFNDYEKVKTELDKYSDIQCIISGGARGADRLAARYARENQILLREYIPNWKRHGKSAGYRRNHDIIKDADIVIAFWDGESRGTKHSIRLAKEAKKTLVIHKF